MKHWTNWMMAIALAAILAACDNDGGPLGPAAGVEDQLRAASVAWDEAHNSGDLGRLMQLYTETAVSMPPNRPALEGRAAIEADFGGFFSDFTAQHRTTIVSLEVQNDLAIEHGRYEFSATEKAGGAQFSESGKHIVVRRRIDGLWKIQWEIWNTDE